MSGYVVQSFFVLLGPQQSICIPGPHGAVSQYTTEFFHLLFSIESPKKIHIELQRAGSIFISRIGKYERIPLGTWEFNSVISIYLMPVIFSYFVLQLQDQL